MNILSLFDGMSCLQIAINRMGVENYTYHASEIKKHAIKCTQHNYPDTIPIGDIRKVSGYDLPKIDFIGAGSPCQDFSIANKERKGLDGEKSGLFFEFVRILKECKEVNPDINFLLENVRMKKDQENIISEILGVKPIAINSNLVSAQNRYRLYWFNFGPQNFDLFGTPSSAIPQPTDKGVLFKDIIEGGNVNEDNSFCLTARYGPGQGSENTLKGRHAKGIWNAVFNDLELSHEQIKRGIKTHSDKTWEKSGNKMGKMDFPNGERPKAKALLTNQNKGARETNHVYLSEKQINSGIKNAERWKKSFPNGHKNKSRCLLTISGGHKGTNTTNRIQEGERIRVLTIKEMERLQTVPEGYTENIDLSWRQCANLLGDGWTVDVICHILQYSPLFKKHETR